MRELGLYDLTPALCRLDYTMSEAGGTAVLRGSIPLPPAGRTATAAIRKNDRKGCFYDSDNS